MPVGVDIIPLRYIPAREGGATGGLVDVDVDVDGGVTTYYSWKWSVRRVEIVH